MFKIVKNGCGKTLRGVSVRCSGFQTRPFGEGSTPRGMGIGIKIGFDSDAGTQTEKERFLSTRRERKMAREKYSAWSTTEKRMT